MTRAFFRYDHLALRYEPLPIGVARPLLDEGLYRELVEAFPPREQFESLAKVGDKLSLSEKFGADRFRALVRSHPLWREFHGYIKSREFITGVLAALRERGVDLGFDPSSSSGKRLRKRVADAIRGGSRTDSLELRSRFEFSMLREGEWNPAWGGGTDINRPKDPARSFNRLNRQLSFDDVEVLDTFSFEPNQAVVFVKTFNSWHSVRPMTAPDREILRRTLTINIETPS